MVRVHQTTLWGSSSMQGKSEACVSCETKTSVWRLLCETRVLASTSAAPHGCRCVTHTHCLTMLSQRSEYNLLWSVIVHHREYFYQMRVCMTLPRRIGLANGKPPSHNRLTPSSAARASTPPPLAPAESVGTHFKPQHCDMLHHQYHKDQQYRQNGPKYFKWRGLMGFVNPWCYFRYGDDKADAALLATPKQSSTSWPPTAQQEEHRPMYFHGQPMRISPAACTWCGVVWAVHMQTSLNNLNLKSS